MQTAPSRAMEAWSEVSASMTSFPGIEATDDTPDEVGPADRSAKWALALTTAVCWFLLRGASIALASIERGLRELLGSRADIAAPSAVVADADVTSVLLVLPVLAFASPLLMLATRWGREGLATRAALFTLGIGAIAASLRFGIGVGQPRPYLILLAGLATLVVAGGAQFLMAMVGLVNRRAIAGGLVGALILRQLSVGMGEARVLVTAMIAVLGLAALWRWHAAPAEERGETFERRAGGMRLRGALALGAILFLELTLGLPIRAHTFPLESRVLAVAVVMIPAALAWLFVVRGVEAPRHRLIAVAGALTVALGLLLDWWGNRVEGSIIAHAAALALVGRALAPASGRRLGKHLAMGLMLFALLSIVSDFALATTRPVLRGTTTTLAVIVLVVTLYLTPRPHRAAPVLSDRVAFAIALALPLLAALAAALRDS